MNTELARKVLDQIRIFPETHNQRSYVKENECGTTCCIAGHALSFSGYTLAHVRDYENAYKGLTFRRPDGGEMVDTWWTEAMDLLGLSHGEAVRLFFEWDNEAAIELLEQMIKSAENGENHG
jgi:hypothetical protein